MAKERSTKPYLIRAICEWCSDSGFTAYLSVKVDANTRVPMEHVKNGEIVLNISPDAAHRLTIGDDMVQFAARFSGVSRECSIPIAADRRRLPMPSGEAARSPICARSPTTCRAKPIGPGK